MLVMAYNGGGRKRRPTIAYHHEDSSENLQPHSRESPVPLQAAGHGETREQERSKVEDSSRRFHRTGSVLENKFSGNQEVSVEGLREAIEVLVQNARGEHQSIFQMDIVFPRSSAETQPRKRSSRKVHGLHGYSRMPQQE